MAPNGRSDEVLGFMAGASRKANTNNIVPVLPATHSVYGGVNILDSGYALYGNPLDPGLINASHPGGTSVSIHFDIIRGGSVTVHSNNATLTLAGDVDFGASGGLGLLGLGDVVISGIVSGNGTITKHDSNYGDLSLSGLGANTYTGLTTVKAGKLYLNRYLIMPGPLFIGQVAVPDDLTIGTGTNVGASVLVVLQRHNQIANTSLVTINGNGQLDLNDNSDTIESLILNGGSVVTRSGTLTVSSDVLVNPASAASVIAGNLVLDGGSFNDFVASGDSRLEIPANLRSDGVIAFTGLLGEFWLAGSNTFSQHVTVDRSTLIVANSYALGSGYPALSNATRLIEATLELDHIAVSNEMLLVDLWETSTLSALGTCGWWGPIQCGNSSDLRLITPSGATLTLGGEVICTTSPIPKSGLGTLVLAGPEPNNFTLRLTEGTALLNKSAGQTATPSLTIGDSLGGEEADVVQLQADEQLRYVQISSSGLLNLSGHDETLSQLTGSGAVSLGSGKLTVSNTTDHVFSGNIRGGRAGLPGADVFKAGAATWSLNGSNTHYGFTYIQDGTLLVNGTILNSPVIVSPGATLGGNGTVRSVSFSGSGGKIAPGASTGRLTAHGAVEMGSGTLEVELNGLTPGTGYDQLITDMAPVMAKGSQLSVVVGFTPPPGSEFLILNNQSASPISGTFNGKPQNGKFAAGGWVFRINYASGNGNDVVLERVVAPAASNLVAGASSGQMLLQAQGFPNATYVLEAAPHLESPIPWTPIGTNVANGTGLVQFMDADMPLHNQRFYRIASP